MSARPVVAICVVQLVCVAALARDARRELTVNLKFDPQEAVHSNSPDLAPAVLERSVAVSVEDGRGGENTDIGRGTNDDDETFPIRASSDVLSYLKETLTGVATDWGLKTSDDKSDRKLTLRLRRFFVDESNKAVGSVYAAEVKFAYVLADQDGKKLAEGAASGTAHRYGRARSAANCNEVLSDALKEAFANVLSDSRLQTAWSSGQPSASAAPASKQESVEERLKKLDELLKKSLITKDEYDKKRAEILKDV